MAQLWLASITSTAPVTIGADRIAVDAAAEFRTALHAVHPRLLPLFKARLLAADDDETSCGGADSGELQLDDAEAIVFDDGSETGLHLSHCAEAFLDRLLGPTEALQLAQAAVRQGLELAETQLIWWNAMVRWWQEGLSVVLLLDD